MTKPQPKKSMKPKTKKADNMVITVLVDESGSMASVWDATMSGFNEYVDTLKKELKDNKVYFSAIKFDTRGVRKLQVGASIADAMHLTRENYQPHGGTPLYDAIGKTIAATDEVMVQQGGGKTILVVQTDGYENESREFNLDDVKRLIEARQEMGWQIVFIGAGINAFEGGRSMGISAANTMSYQKDARSTRSLFGSMAQNTQLYASGAAGTMNFSADQSADAGEADAITRAKMGGATPTPSVSINNLSLTS